MLNGTGWRKCNYQFQISDCLVQFAISSSFCPHSSTKFFVLKSKWDQQYFDSRLLMNPQTPGRLLALMTLSTVVPLATVTTARILTLSIGCRVKSDTSTRFTFELSMWFGALTLSVTSSVSLKQISANFDQTRPPPTVLSISKISLRLSRIRSSIPVSPISSYTEWRQMNEIHVYVFSAS